MGGCYRSISGKERSLGRFSDSLGRDGFSASGAEVGRASVRILSVYAPTTAVDRTCPPPVPSNSRQLITTDRPQFVGYPLAV